jgi:hypothetical protein
MRESRRQFMILRNAVITVAGLALTSLVAVSVMSQERPLTDRPATQPSTTQPAQRGVEVEIETWVRHAMPAKEHKLLDRMAGRWETVSTYWKAPGAPPVESKGTAERKWILDGRFMMEELDGGVLVMPFRGVGLYGFDAFEKKYTSAWLDTTSTAICTYLGVYDEKKDLVDFVGDYGDPWTGEKKRIRGVTRFMGHDKHALELYLPKEGGGEHKLLEIVYTRRAVKHGESATGIPTSAPRSRP